MGYGVSARKILLAIIVLLTLFLGRLEAADSERIQLDADSISFEEESGVAIAEGNVRINNSDMRLFAPYVEYDSFENHVKATSSPEGGVTFITAAGRLSGERLDYNLSTREGFLTKPSGKVDAFYVKGETIEVKPAPQAGSSKKNTDVESDPDDMAADWSQASLTTCGDPKPHYRLEAKSISVVENSSLVIKRPKVYLGDKMIFAYPFDYYVSLKESDKRRRQVLFPKLGYESNKGAGIGLTGGYGWESGFAELEVIGWSEEIWEGSLNVTQDITDYLSVYADLDRKYDKDSDRTMWRPGWGLDYDKNGWKMRAAWSQRELVTVEKRAGRDSRYVVWKEPEVNLMTPWFDDTAAGGKFRLLASWGRYEDATNGPGKITQRTGLGGQIYGELGQPKENFHPFYNAVYWHYDYDTDDSDSQKLLDTVLGVRWKLGDFDMESAYLRRWSWGNSPMYWDAYDPREEVYQEVGYTIPTRDQGISWKLGVRAAYDIIDDDLSEMLYKVAYDQHCLLWEAIYRDDRDGNDNWFGFKLTVKAFPESGVRLSGNDPFNPMKGPNELVPLETDRN